MRWDPGLGLCGPGKLDGLRFIRRAVELAQLHQHLDFRRLTVLYMNAELDFAWITFAGTEAVAPWKPWFALFILRDEEKSHNATLAVGDASCALITLLVVQSDRKTMAV
jgi:hypothetical protein